MFSKEELLREYKTLTLKPFEFVQSTYFNGVSHPHLLRDIESCYDIIRARVEFFDSALQFYCTSVVSWELAGSFIPDWEKYHLGWISAEIEASLCMPIPTREFRAKVDNFLDEVCRMVKLPPMDEFVGALQMKDEWNDKAILAQYKQEFIYLHWSTGA